MKAWEIVGYTFNADVYCPHHIIAALPTGDGEPFDGWTTVVPMSTEDNLSEIAYAFQIDRMDESSFDYGDFPKVIFASDASEDDYCATCGETL